MLSGILDYIFPKRCVNCKALGDYLCANCFNFLSFDTKSLCLVCKKQSLNGLTHKNCKKKYTIDGCFSAVRYNYIARKLIYNFKNRPYLVDLQSFLTELFYESLIQSEEFMKLIQKDKWVFVPIPVSKATFRKRGYNQAEILAKNLSRKFKIRVFEIDQLDKNISNVFLIDDFVKTGLVLKKTTELLKKKGIEKTYGLTLAG